jgi:hypothetical protein
MKLSDFATLADAQAHFEDSYVPVQTKYIWSLLMSFGDAKEIEKLKTSAKTVQLEAGIDTTIGDIITGIMEMLTLLPELDLSPLTLEGIFINKVFDLMIVEGGIKANAVALMRTRSELRTFPFAEATELEFATAKGTMTHKVLSTDGTQLDDGYGVFNLTAQTPLQFPKVFHVSPRTGERRHIATVRNVSLVGPYEVFIPMTYRKDLIEIEDYYALMGD